MLYEKDRHDEERFQPSYLFLDIVKITEILDAWVVEQMIMSNIFIDFFFDFL